MSYTNKYLPGIELQTPQEVAAYIAAHPGDERARWWKVAPAPGNALGLTTDDIPEGIVNLYYNPSRVSKEIADAVASLEIPEASDDLPQPLGTATAGIAAEYSRGDHVHEMPTASDVGAATTSHAHAASDVTSGVFDAARIPALPYLPTSQKGAANGVAELDAGGRVPSGQLPSYVDDVLEYANLAAFPATGETGKIYVNLDQNKTWRWSGSAYVEISASLALGETSSTAYRGDRGKTAYDHSQSTGNPHGATAADVGAFPAWFAVGGIDFNTLGQGVWSLRTGPASNGWAGLTSLQNAAVIEAHGADGLKAQIAADMRWGGLLTRSQMSEFANAWSPWWIIWDSGSLPAGAAGKAVLAASSTSTARSAIGAAPIAGVTDGSNASSGNVGQYLEALLPDSSPVFAVNGSPVAVLSLSIPAGDWLVEGRATAYITGTMNGNRVVSGLNTSVAIPTDGTEVYGGMQVFSSINGFQTMTGSKRFSLSAATTVYLVGRIDFSAGTPALFGFMSARRMR